MKIAFFVTLLPLFIALSIVGIFGKKADKQPVSVEYFKDGQILLPDYACPDTLIVTNADQLNEGMALIEQGIIDATDDQIDSVLHSAAVLYTANSGLQPVNFEQIR